MLVTSRKRKYKKYTKDVGKQKNNTSNFNLTPFYLVEVRKLWLILLVVYGLTRMT